jgi:hypothetical protein
VKRLEAPRSARPEVIDCRQTLWKQELLSTSLVDDQDHQYTQVCL